jgi:hypothetical protein
MRNESRGGRNGRLSRFARSIRGETPLLSLARDDVFEGKVPTKRLPNPKAKTKLASVRRGRSLCSARSVPQYTQSRYSTHTYIATKKSRTKQAGQMPHKIQHLSSASLCSASVTVVGWPAIVLFSAFFAAQRCGL